MQKKLETSMNGSGKREFRVAVGIATSGRALILAETLGDLQRQTQPPAEVFVVYGQQSDIADLPERFPAFRFLKGEGGSCGKRNRVLDELRDNSGAEIVFFMDDDFLLAPRYLQVTGEAFRRDEHLVAATGRVLADGAKGPGLTVEQGRAVLARAPGTAVSLAPRPVFNAYGCNMAFRLSTVREHAIRFDERLPAYGWYEDIDFSRRLALHGSVLCLQGALGVHLGAKVGRGSGRKLGYSQVANPVYLWRKGSFPFPNTLRSIGRNVLANCFRSVAPEAYVDRRGRLGGNLLALTDLVRGRMHPSRILDLG